MTTRVVIIDDDPVVRMLLGECLKVNGIDVESHQSGKTALESMAQSDSKPNLVFVDLMMPDMTGFDVIKGMKDNPGTSNIPVVLLSAVSDHKVGSQEGYIQPDRFLEKPWDMTKLLETIKELTQNR